MPGHSLPSSDRNSFWRLLPGFRLFYQSGLREKPGKPTWFTGGMKGQSPMSAPTLNQAFPHEKPQVERSEAPYVYAGVFHVLRQPVRLSNCYLLYEQMFGMSSDSSRALPGNRQTKPLSAKGYVAIVDV